MKFRYFIFLCNIFFLHAVSISAQNVPALISPADNSIQQRTTSLELSWQNLPGSPVYIVEYSTDSIFSPEGIVSSISVSGNSVVIGGLSNDTEYFWRVRVNEQTAPWSEVWSFRTTALPEITRLIFPQNLSTNRNVEQLFLWTSSKVNTKYMLQLGFNPGFTGNIYNYVTSDTSFAVNDLMNNRAYYWRVKAYNIDNAEASWSSTWLFKTKLKTPALTAPVNSIINTDTSLVFKWSAVDSASVYNFQLSRDSSFGISIINNSLTETQLGVNSLSHITNYYWRVIASSASGDSSNWSKIHSFRTNLHSTNFISPSDSLRNSDTSITVKWHKVSAADNYAIQLYADSLGNPIFSQTITDTMLLIDSLSYNKKYFIQLAGFTEDGDSSKRATLMLKTMLSSPVPVSPVNKSRNVSPDTLFTWNPVAGAEFYNIEIGYDSLFNSVFADTSVEETVFESAQLNFDTTYYWRITAYNSTGDSSKTTAPLFFKTRPPVLFSSDSAYIELNLSQYRKDSLFSISVSNIGQKSFVIDSVKADPDSIFIINKTSVIVQPDDEEQFEVKFSPALIDTGITEGKIFFIRNNILSQDTLVVKINVYIEKANPSFSDSSLAYDSVNAQSSSVQEITFRNYGGNLNLRIDSLGIIGEDSSSFKIITNLKTFGNIQPNDSSLLKIQFIPEKLGAHSAFLHIQSNSYPDSLFLFPLSGSGRGGEFSSTTLTRISELSDSLFEAFSDNDKPIVFKNNGNAPINVSIRFTQNKFKIGNDFLRDFDVRRGDSVFLAVKYLIPDFTESVKDTMRIIHSGFGEDTLLIFLEGTFDRLASSQKIQSDLRLNSLSFSAADKIVNENTPLNFSLDPDLLQNYPHLEFRINYYTGGHGSRLLAENDGSYNFNIPKEYLDQHGLLISGQIIAKDKNNKIIDSLTVFPPFNTQVILKDYKTVNINIPKSIPAEKAEDANTKWIMFGFPFEEAVADTVFKDFGGIEKMKDGEWIIYNYDYSASDSFSLFSDYSFEPNHAYFAAQALMDTFKISYTYKENLRTRKLTDTVLTLPGTNWKTVSSPYLFDVEVDPSVMLRRYDPNNKVYKMTNIMKPGEGYFVEPGVSQLRLKTYGEFNPLYYPKILKDIGWHVLLKVSDGNYELENLFSVQSERLEKAASLPREYTPAPRLGKGLAFYTKGNNTRSEVTVKTGSDGAVFDIALLNDLKDDNLNFSVSTEGNLPSNYIFRLFNEETKEVMSFPAENFFIRKNKEYNLKLLTGTENFVNKTISDLINQLPEKFVLNQNYPNPFNPVTRISYQLPENSFVSIKVYDILGSEVVTLANEEKPAGYYSIEFNAANLASGVYLYTIKAGAFNQTKKMVLLK